LVQEAGRARAGLRGEDEPLDIHLWTDVPLPELGPVIPVLWADLDGGLDWVMLAAGGVALECVPDAVKVYPGLFTADGLNSSRREQSWCFPYKESLIGKTPSLLLFQYQKAGERQRPHQAAGLLVAPAARAFLEDRLGPLVRFEVVEGECVKLPPLFKKGRG
jgi:hypothetical protein